MKKLIAILVVLMYPVAVSAQVAPTPVPTYSPPVQPYQIIPSSAANATVGGIYPWGFPNGISVQNGAQIFGISTFYSSVTLSQNLAVLGSETIGTPLGLTSGGNGTTTPPAVNVTSAGALCNGATNDLTAIQNLINAQAGKGDVLIPSGNACMLGGGLIIPSNTHLTIDGLLMLLPSANAAVISVNSGSKNILIDGVGVLDGNKSNQTSVCGSTVGCAGVGINGASNVIVRGVTIQNMYNWPVNVTASSNVYTEYVTALNSGNSFEFATTSTNCWADHVTINGINDGAFTFYGGVSRSGITNSDVSGGIAGGIGVYDDSAQPGATHDILIAHNIIHNNTGVYGSGASASGGSAAPYNINWIGNDFYANGGGISLQNGTGLLVQGNQMHQDTGFGVFVSTSYTAVKNNQIWDEGQGSTGGVGISVASTSQTFVNVTNNTIYDDQSSRTMSVGINGGVGLNSTISQNDAYNMINASVAITTSSDTQGIQCESILFRRCYTFQSIESPGVIIGTGTGSLPFWNTGTGVPSGSCVSGGLFVRTDGAAGATTYDCRGGNWYALSGG